MKKMNKIRLRIFLQMIDFVLEIIFALMIPLYYIVDCHITRWFYFSCATYLALSLLEYFFIKNGKHLAIVFVVFLLHVLSYT